MSLGNVPLGLKAAKPYVKIGLELYKTRPVVAYHCFSYAITLGLQSDYKSDKDLRSYLMTLMDYVEKVKQALIQQEDLVDSVTKDLEGFNIYNCISTISVYNCLSFYHKYNSCTTDRSVTLNVLLA